MTATNLPPIRADLVAAKIEKAANFEQPEVAEEMREEPRLIEALWALQHFSQPDNYPGGLTKLAGDFIEAQSESIGTATMHKLRGSERYSADDAIAILSEFPYQHHQDLLGENSWMFTNELRSTRGNQLRVSIETGCEWSDLLEEAGPRRPAAYNPSWEGTRREWEKLLVEALTPNAARGVCVAQARAQLAEHFKQHCEQPQKCWRTSDTQSYRKIGNGAPWYFTNVSDALLDYIDLRKHSLGSRIAQTEITKLVFEWMSVAHETRRGVLIEGNSRFGKTEAVRLFCEMNPGTARLVNTPATNAVGDLLREVARALGIDSTPGRRGYDLRESIDYVLRFSNLLLCFDESNFLLPGSYSKNTAPARLNWVRRSLMDRKIATVFVYTPQSNLPAKKRFIKTTGYTMEQFDERMLMTLHLPNELSEDDLLAVARIHFPQLREIYLSNIVDKVLAAERNYVSDIEKIATLANYKAKAGGRAVPLLDDINAAIANVLPVAKASPQIRIEPVARIKRLKPSTRPRSLSPQRSEAEALSAEVPLAICQKARQEECAGEPSLMKTEISRQPTFETTASGFHNFA